MPEYYFFALIAIFKISNYKIMLARLAFLIAPGSAILIYLKIYEKRLLDLRIGKFIILSGLVLLTNLILASIVFTLFFDQSDSLVEIVAQAFYGFLIGSGIGFGLEIGILIYDMFSPKPVWHKHRRKPLV